MPKINCVGELCPLCEKNSTKVRLAVLCQDGTFIEYKDACWLCAAKACDKLGTETGNILRQKHFNLYGVKT